MAVRGRAKTEHVPSDVRQGRTGKGDEVNKNTKLFQPLRSPEPVCVDKNEVAQALERLAESEGGQHLTGTGFQEERDPEEAIVVLLDVSKSMDDTGFVEPRQDGEGDDDDEEEEDDDEAEDDAMDQADEDDEGEEAPGRMPRFPNHYELPCPAELRCPIHGGLMIDPVRLPHKEGHAGGEG
jgi:hypothetical protein